MRSSPYPMVPFTKAQRLWIILALVLIPLTIVYGILPDKRIPFTPVATGNIPLITDVRYKRDTDAAFTKISLPYHFTGRAEEVVDFIVSMNYKTGQSGQFALVPDDCVDTITVNKTAIELSGAALQHRCDTEEGLSVDLRPALKEGENEVVVTIANKRGKMGMMFYPFTK